MALRLARLFGNSPEFWLNAQRSVDLWTAAQSVKEEVDRIKSRYMLHKPSRAPDAKTSAFALVLSPVTAGVSLTQKGDLRMQKLLTERSVNCFSQMESILGNECYNAKYPKLRPRWCS